LKTLGVDVSHWEGRIDWAAAAQSVLFAYYKCTDGISFVDPTFEWNKQGCSAAGLPHAPFHWYKHDQDPDLQAAHFVDITGSGYHRLIVDVEEEDNNSVELHEHLIKIEQLSKIRPAIYTNFDTWNSKVKPFPNWSKDYELVVANYNLSSAPILPIGWSTYIIWQFSKFIWFQGCSEIADGDWFNGDLVACRDWFGNYRQVNPPIYDHLKLRSQFDQLHVRKAPRTSALEVAHLMKGDQVVVDELGGADVWIHHSQGWTCVEHNGYRYMEVVK
jgi:GH25 family lysozyme M1 (1,4-beta-N-acetylmuramidase)